MTKVEYLKKMGFEINPFQYTNADKEKDYIERYFIFPDYFEDVWGDPVNPVSNIIYAPRGAGKTAQRIMIEKRAQKHENLITITYTDHDLSNFTSASEISLNYHLEYLNRLLLLSFFTRLSTLEDIKFVNLFSFNERQYLYKLCKIYLYDTPASFPKQALKSLKTIEDIGLDLWKKFKAPFSEVIKNISKAKGVEIDLSKIEVDKSLKFSHKDNLSNILSLLGKLNIDSVYILVDKVDEQSLTGNDPKASYQFISSLIKDLELLEMPKLAFKFFLWDALIPLCAIDARPDRVFSFKLKWTDHQIKLMLDKRLAAYSQQAVTDSFKLFQEKKNLGRIVLFSEFSPRDSIRICNRILSEQYKHDFTSPIFQSSIVNNAIDEFSKEKIKEILPDLKSINYLIKTNTASFTNGQLVNDKVAGTAAAIRNITRPWASHNISKKIGLVTRKGKKAVNEYAFIDIRAARVACSSMSLDNFINNKVRRCSGENCSEIYYRNFDNAIYTCPECGTIGDPH
ncbi:MULTISPECIES: P-loop ATPase, Sll1717 family [Flavobacteriaceae]|jgi:hypothetical protein|uniref:Uncharacterized protein n=1 Tax=Christiangramia sediminicola TaxID=3073267 RepID=A0ABU1EKW8_9FLAO|nr:MULTISPECIES: hypothetical protein [Flavobacteriaceae]MDR5589023.1 hypothetical protein [Christiangramia sp. SM2212]